MPLTSVERKKQELIARIKQFPVEVRRNKRRNIDKIYILYRTVDGAKLKASATNLVSLQEIVELLEEAFTRAGVERVD